MVKINLNDPDLMAATEAAEIWGKNPTYVRTSLRQTPDKWPAGSWRLFGRQLVVTTEGMEAATGDPDPRKK
ncbi:helix-turn-helix domain-containing protein [Lacticaseibacillus hulanensis]|uniref:helix-turn-helix domain-containing protein n=1 Tax=Lacticaseibacillus hulanensis TaxID=2493111 RepID=UPI000FD91036|nr:helix-turn-helix domain-containing protein [Lacticaseibacillus hulanensis]